MLTESAGLLKVDSFLSVIIKGLFWLFLIEDVIHVFGTFGTLILAIPDTITRDDVYI